MTLDDALAELRKAADPGRAAQMAAYHKIDRPYLGVANPKTDSLARKWRQSLDLKARLDLARLLWETNIFEARVAAAKLLTQARIKPSDEAAWTLIQSWVPDFDSWAIADHVCMSGQRRLTADPSRLDMVETWITSDRMWTRRAALVITLPWTKQNHPSADEERARDRVLGWAETYLDDPEWFIQKAIAWWLRDLSKHDPERTRAFLAEHGSRLKPFARKEAARLLPV
ncbi:DNA alkylation repair protein [Marivita sp. XM-24bin2]|jgi:3-methyladenine DNA glycosylase AlkD|uniref:DNA alkylation repair protein n=1 Tax=unclassified Marivita TaxID=2632480 RepID=UPI000D797A76|nr:DNA alkylation repair protein [Marivita sp. XM-24bin2]MCR9107579.1 DNA alkylation repair protein [Paracoccaceae bacterium]PWL34843.1 MAG: DNA alkylation repair protein [Marivita sp. XM-24bin2]